MEQAMDNDLKLILVRHAQAGDAAEFARSGQPDNLRPLTDQGVTRMREAVQGLASLLSGPMNLVSSPYVRARQTAEILAEMLPTGPIRTCDQLVPEAHPSALVGGLFQEQPEGLLILVGHEPHLSRLAGWLMSGRPDSLVRMKKGGVCALQLSGPPRAGCAMLHWLLTQRQLRRL
jgi:phosphohistidine phosphatase